MASSPGCSASIKKGVKDTLIKYDTLQEVRFNAPFIALCKRCIQGLILGYIIVYVFIIDKGYQKFDKGESSVVTKVKGNQKNTILKRNVWGGSRFSDDGSIWDPADYVVPPLENDALFIATKVTTTHMQKQSVCAEENLPEARCSKNDHCLVGESIHSGHGLKSGICVQSTGTCEVHAWCPLENRIRANLLAGGENLTVLVKNFVLFPKFQVKRRNIGDLPMHYLRNCIYDPVTDPFCPIFSLGRIIAMAGENYTEMANQGAVLSFAITWDCNLDFDIKHCQPKYSFRRLDNKMDKSFPGWNFRLSGYWSNNGKLTRYLIKAAGIRIVFNVYCVAGKFDVVKFTMNLGSGLGLLGMANLFCDYILCNCTKPETRRLHAEVTLTNTKETDSADPLLASE